MTTNDKQAHKNSDANTELGQKKPEEMQKEIDILVTLLKEALLEIQNLKTRLNQYEKPEGSYLKSSSWITKIVFIITKAGKPLRSSEIITLLNAREPVLNEKVSKEKFLSPFLNTAMKYKRLIPYKIKGVRGNYYRLPEWMNTITFYQK